jgi:hypothetical protein
MSMWSDMDRLPIVLAIKRILAAICQESVGDFAGVTHRIGLHSQVRLRAVISSLGVYVLFRTTNGQPTLAAPSTHSMYSIRFPAIMATISPFLMFVASSARAVVSLRVCKSRKLHLSFCHGTTRAVLSPNRLACSCKSSPMVLCHNGRSVGPWVKDCVCVPDMVKEGRFAKLQRCTSSVRETHICYHASLPGSCVACCRFQHGARSSPAVLP